MKNAFLVIIFCLSSQFVQGSQAPAAELSYWQNYAPEFIQNTTTATYNYAASWIPTSIKDRVNTWSRKKKLAVTGAAIASLLAIYNKDQLIAWVTNVLNQQKDDLVPYSMEEVLQNGKAYEVDDMIRTACFLLDSSMQEERLEGLNMLKKLIQDPNLSKRFPDRADHVINLLQQLSVSPSFIVKDIQRNR